jgi:hypothetical protein
MQEIEAGQANSELKDLVVEASQALARLDTARLEELALSCQALILGPMTGHAKQLLARQAHEAAGDMAVFSRVLEATRANQNVMIRLKELREGSLEYSERQVRGGSGAEAGHGQH